MAPGSRGSGGLSRRAALALIGGGGLLSISASGAFDRVDANRPFELEVDDETAVLDIKTFSPIEVSSAGETVDVVELHNRFPDATFDSVSVTSDDSILSINRPLQQGETLDYDEKLLVQGTVDTASSQTKTVELTITVSGASERIQTTRNVTITANVGPSGCPVSLNIGVGVGDDARDGSTVSKNLKDEEVSGDIDVSGNIKIENSVVDGSVTADGNVDIKDSDIDGSVSADNTNGNVTIEKSNVNGDIVGGNNVDIKDSDIDGSITAGGTSGDVKVENSTVAGGIDAGGNVNDIKDSQIGGSIIADGNIKVEKSIVCGDITVDGNVNEIKDSEVGGDITADGNVTIKSGSTVFGSIDAGGNVKVDGTVEGDVYAGGTVTGSGTIKGNDPRPSSGPPS